jgi:hypothetical protein
VWLHALARRNCNSEFVAIVYVACVSMFTVGGIVDCLVVLGLVTRLDCADVQSLPRAVVSKPNSLCSVFVSLIRLD